MVPNEIWEEEPAACTSDAVLAKWRWGNFVALADWHN